MAEATSQLSILVKVRDEASAALSRLSNDVSDLGGSLNFAGLKAGVLAGAMSAIAGAALLNGLKAFAEAEVQMARFDAILKTLPPSLQAYREQMLQTAETALDLGFDNETAALSIARLFQATKDASFSFQAFQAAMDLSRAKGISLEQATQALILAFQGGGKLLRQFGIEVDDHASKETILAAVMQQVRGQADAYAGTLTGLTDVLKLYLAEVNEALGQQFAPFVKNVIEQIKEWVKEQGGINALIERHNTLLTIAGSLLFGVFVAGLAAAASTALAAMGAFGTLLAGIGALIGIGALFASAWATNFLHVRDIVSNVVNFLSGILNGLISTVNSVISAVSRFASLTAGTVSSAIGAVKGFLGLAEGGIVTRPTFAMVGEAGAEAVIPLSRLGGAGLGSNITINLQGDFYTDTETAERFANKIANLIKYQLKL